tara:strand:+ start:493 stop:651 length:159 start_codon:yes stop_codon:yes gene_type:complete
MIRFSLGILSLILTVGALEGTADLSLIIITATVGIIFLSWGIIGMFKKGQLA